MIEQRHGLNMPTLGTFDKAFSCPTGQLGADALTGHKRGMVPNNVTRLRKLRGLTQPQLAKMVGTTKDTLIKLEKGSRPLNTDWLDKLSAALGVEPFQIIAPDRLFPSEEEVADMLRLAQQRLPVDLPYSEWPKALAGDLHIRLQLLADDRASEASEDRPQ